MTLTSETDIADAMAKVAEAERMAAAAADLVEAWQASAGEPKHDEWKQKTAGLLGVMEKMKAEDEAEKWCPGTTTVLVVAALHCLEMHYRISTANFLDMAR